jgi:hypothetical protein
VGTTEAYFPGAKDEFCLNVSLSTDNHYKRFGDQVTLSRAGKVGYKARSGKKVSCSKSGRTSTIETFSMKVKKSGWAKGKWRVTKWLKVASAKKNGCGAGGRTRPL